jgi:hypothetical protein
MGACLTITASPSDDGRCLTARPSMAIGERTPHSVATTSTLPAGSVNDQTYVLKRLR